MCKFQMENRIFFYFFTENTQPMQRNLQAPFHGILTCGIFVVFGTNLVLEDGDYQSLMTEVITIGESRRER